MAKEKKEKPEKEKKAKKEKPEKEKKSKVKKVKEKGEKGEKKPKGSKKDKEEREEEAPKASKKKLIIIVAALLVLLAGGGAAAYFLVLAPMNAVEEPEEDPNALIDTGPVKPSGYFGYLSHNGVGTDELLIDSVDLIRASETLLIDQMGLTEEQMAPGFYISNPQAASRLIYVDQGTVFTIISRETGHYEEVTWSAFLAHLSTSSILFEITSTNNILDTVVEFPINNFSEDNGDNNNVDYDAELPPAEEESPEPPDVIETLPSATTEEETAEEHSETTEEPSETTEESVATEGEATPEATTPESATPEATTPEATAPEATTPEETTPEATTPEATTPEATAPEATTPEATTPEAATDTTPVPT